MKGPKRNSTRRTLKTTELITEALHTAPTGVAPHWADVRGVSRPPSHSVWQEASRCVSFDRARRRYHTQTTVLVSPVGRMVTLLCSGLYWQGIRPSGSWRN